MKISHDFDSSIFNLMFDTVGDDYLFKTFGASVYILILIIIFWDMREAWSMLQMHFEWLDF